MLARAAQIADENKLLLMCNWVGETMKHGHFGQIHALRVRCGSGDNSWQDVVTDRNNRADGGQEWNFLRWDSYFEAIKASQSIVSVFGRLDNTGSPEFGELPSLGRG